MMQSDWHSADIIAALKKRGTTLSAVSCESALAPSTLANTFIRHRPKGKRLISQAIGVLPEQIWPSRYR